MTSLSTNDFSTLYTTLPHNLIKEKLLDLIQWTFKRALKTMVHFIWPVMTEKLLFTSSDQSRYTLWSCQNVCDALSYSHVRMYAMPYPISWIIFISDLELIYRQIVGIPMGTNCAPLVADLFYTATKEISWILLTMTIKLMLSRLLIRLLGTSMTILILKAWSNTFIPLNYS